MNNGRFATSIHILTILALSDEVVTSDYIAESVNVNSVIIRKEISNLKNFGLIESREGKGGGSLLAKSAARIRLSEVYAAVMQSPLLGRSNKTSRKCPIGKEMNEHIDALYSEAETTLIKTLNKITLADFTGRFSITTKK